MISALRKIEAHAAIPAMPSRMQYFFIESPALHPGSGWFATHPSVDARVAALIKFAGGRDVSVEVEGQALSESIDAPRQAEHEAEAAFLPKDGRAPLSAPRGPWGSASR
jgi:heat shock protein HtpX